MSFTIITIILTADFVSFKLSYLVCFESLIIIIMDSYLIINYLWCKTFTDINYIKTIKY